jgi:uroporphyrinogen-III synthase
MKGTGMRLRGRVSSLDGSRTVDVDNESDDHVALVSQLAEKALREGAAEMIGSAAASAPMPLRGRRILVTRARDQAADLCGKIAAAGGSPVSVPLIRIAPLEDTPELDAAIERIDTYHWLIFASANSVEFFMKRLRAIRPDAPWVSGSPRVAAVGPGTKAALESSGVSTDFMPGVHTGTALAEELFGKEGAGLAGARVLMPRALEGREDPALLLRRQGAIVDDAPAYRTEPRTPSAEDLASIEQGVDAVLFASSSAVNAWCDQVRGGGPLASAARRAVIACIGPSTVATAREQGLRVDVEADDSTGDGLVAALVRHFAREGRTP